MRACAAYLAKTPVVPGLDGGTEGLLNPGRLRGVGCQVLSGWLILGLLIPWFFCCSCRSFFPGKPCSQPFLGSNLEGRRYPRSTWKLLILQSLKCQAAETSGSIDQPTAKPYSRRQKPTNTYMNSMQQLPSAPYLYGLLDWITAVLYQDPHIGALGA